MRIADKPKIGPEEVVHGRGDGARGGTNGNNGGRRRQPVPPETYRLGMWLALAALTMLFFAMTSAYIVRRGLGADWRAIPMPPVLLLNTALLLASSVTMEKSRRLLKSDRHAASRWLSATFLLGLAFLFGQFIAWQNLAAQGLYLSTNAHSSFFYLLTGLHGCHVLGGIFALGYVVAGVWRNHGPLLSSASERPALFLPSPASQVRWVEATALYWHFVDGLWLYLLVLLFR